MNRQHLSKLLKIFEVTGEKSKNIKLLPNSLRTIHPTSIESERAEHDSSNVVY